MKRSLIYLLALGALVSMSARAGQVPEEAKKHMAYGAAALEEAKDEAGFQKAVEEFETTSKSAPEWAAPYYNLGVVYSKLKDWEKARANYQRYLELAPKAKDAAAVKAEIYKMGYKQKQLSDLSEFYGEYYQACNEGFAHQDTLYFDENGSGGYYMIIFNNTDGSRLWNENLFFDMNDKGVPDSFKTNFHYSPNSTMSSSAPLKLVIGTLSRRGGPYFMPQEKDKTFITVSSDARGIRDQFCSMVFLLENKTWRWPGKATPAPPPTSPTSFGGVGIVLSSKDGNPKVQRLVQGAPAQKAGIQAGDEIFKVDGEETKTMSSEQMVEHLRGAAGTTVVLTLRRAGRKAPFKVMLIRETILAP